jgi:hypothetical protein
VGADVFAGRAGDEHGFACAGVQKGTRPMLITGASSQNIEHLTSSSWWFVSQGEVARVVRLSDGSKVAISCVLAHLSHEQEDGEHAEHRGEDREGAGH